MRVTYKDYADELELHFNDPRDLAQEAGDARQLGPLLWVIAGMKGGEYLPYIPDSNTRVERTGVVIDGVEITLSGFGARDKRPGEKTTLTTAQKIAIRRKDAQQPPPAKPSQPQSPSDATHRHPQYRPLTDEELRKRGLL